MTEERAFLQALLEQPGDYATRQVYADWLEEQGDPRAEYLRLVLQARQERSITPEQRQRHDQLFTELAALRLQAQQEWENTWATNHHSPPENPARLQRELELERQLATLSQQIRQRLSARLQELAASFDPRWVAVVSDSDIEGCGKHTGQSWRLRFDFLCDKTWADLKPTCDDNIRHCETCSENVHYCDTLADAREHAAEGRCIVVDLGIIRREEDLFRVGVFGGRPSKEDMRRRYEEDVDPLSRARLEARKQAR